MLVYRPDVTVNPFGDPVDADGNVIRPESPGTYLGTITGVVFGDLSVESLSRGVDTNTSSGNATSRGDFAMTDGLIGFPRNASITVQARDVIVEGEIGKRYQLLGPHQWKTSNLFTGRPNRYYWLRAQGIV